MSRPALDALEVSETARAHPDRYEKHDILSTTIHEVGTGRYAVQGTESEDAHVAELLREPRSRTFFGGCSCKGFEYHDGPCSHLCVLIRATNDGILEPPRAKVTRATLEVIDRQQQIADSVDGREEQGEGPDP